MTRDEMDAKAEASFSNAYKPTGNAQFDLHLRHAYLMGFAHGGAYGVSLASAAIQTGKTLAKISLESK